MARTWAMLGAVLALGSPLAAAAQAPPDVFARQTLAVTDRVHLIYKPAVTDPPFEGNVVVIEQSAGLVVVDAGGSPVSGRDVVDEIRKFSRKPVRWLIYTHYHGDHNLGAGAFRQAWPKLRIVSTAATRTNMTGPAMDYVRTYAKSYGDMAAFAATQARDEHLPQALRDGWARTAAAGPGMVAGYTDMSVYPADQTFTDRFSIPDHAAPVEVMFLGRGNTDGDAVVWAPKQRVVASGDLVVAPIPYAAHTYPGEWIATLKRLEGLDFAYLVPGHGPVETDRAYVDKVITALDNVRAQVGPLARADVLLDEVRKRIDLKPMRHDFAGDDPWLGFLFGAVFAGDLVSNAYKEARGETVIQGRG
ncbi:metallo-beta-lactamase superfamily protein [mine drainage metagenome]|uniref:Metallo-beta-lactamase superfamily protein n=1 Tax=mine drainage metagenome TaxID=410659 RepID=A0A1J5PI30_9ZZZZ